MQKCLHRHKCPRADKKVSLIWTHLAQDRFLSLPEPGQLILFGMSRSGESEITITYQKTQFQAHMAKSVDGGCLSKSLTYTSQSVSSLSLSFFLSENISIQTKVRIQLFQGVARKWTCIFALLTAAYTTSSSMLDLIHYTGLSANDLTSIHIASWDDSPCTAAIIYLISHPECSSDTVFKHMCSVLVAYGLWFFCWPWLL